MRARVRASGRQRVLVLVLVLALRPVRALVWVPMPVQARALVLRRALVWELRPT